MIDFASFIRVANVVSWLTLHVTPSIMSTRILNPECEVLLLDKINIAISDVAIASVIYPFDLTSTSKFLYKKAFPIPSGLSIKKLDVISHIFGFTF